MKTGLNKREKVLVLIAAVVLISFLAIQFLIIPMYKTYAAKLEELDIRTADKADMEMKLSNETLYRTGYANAQSAYQDIAARYPIKMSNEEIDRLLTGLSREHKLNPLVLGISTDNSVKEISGDEEEPVAPAAYTVVTANMNVSGTYDSLLSVIDEVERIDYIRIGHASYTRSSETEVTGSPNITLFFEITMLNEMM